MCVNSIDRRARGRRPSIASWLRGRLTRECLSDGRESRTGNQWQGEFRVGRWPCVRATAGVRVKSRLAFCQTLLRRMRPCGSVEAGGRLRSQRHRADWWKETALARLEVWDVLSCWFKLDFPKYLARIFLWRRNMPVIHFQRLFLFGVSLLSLLSMKEEKG